MPDVVSSAQRVAAMGLAVGAAFGLSPAIGRAEPASTADRQRTAPVARAGKSSSASPPGETRRPTLKMRTRHGGADGATSRAKRRPTSKRAPRSGSPSGVERRDHRDAVGLLAVGLLYHAHIATGVIADAMGGRVYSRGKVRTMLRANLGMLRAADRELARLAARRRSTAHRRALAEAVAVLRLLEEQTRALARYAASAADVDLRVYRHRRKLTWKRLSRLLRPRRATKKSKR